ncbi:MAG TPA: ATP-binding cassette domain-containing protein [Usitatibacter sp.]|nr:ATP-binding cassette domain-containing protein [Usitatibacter sp.]
MSDPGLSYAATTLPAAFRLLEFGDGPGIAEGAIPGPSPNSSSNPAEAVEALALAVGRRSRRVLLDSRWWQQAPVAMIGRVADRRRVARGDEAPAHAPDQATGWVALLPRKAGGYTMRAIDPQSGRPIEWKMDAHVASRLAPFAFTFHPRFAPRVLGGRDILAFALRAGGGELALIALAGLAAALLGLFPPVVTGWLIDRAIPVGSTATVIALIAALALAGVTSILLEVLRTLAVMRLDSKVGVDMQAALIDRLVCAPTAFFRRYASGDLALRAASLGAVQRSVTGSALASFLTSVFVLANLALMLAYSVPLTLAAMAIVLLVIAASTTFGLLRLKVGPRIEALDGRLGAMTFEIFAGIAKLRAAAAEARVFRAWYERYDAFREANRASAKLSNHETVVLSVLQPAATILVLALAWKLASSPTYALSTGEFVAFHAALFGLLAAVHGLVATVLDVVNLRPMWERARPILETLPEDAGRRGERHEPSGDITLESVSFAYPGGPDVLHGVDLRIRPGEFLAIVGSSGSGKSTLLRLLLGFESPREGSVRYDGRNLATLELRHLRSRIGTVLQAGKLWSGDLLTNILGASNLGAEAAMDAARRAGLAADIEAMPMGLYTMAGEGLSTLSGGQRQRVLLARALVGEPRILLLDEATSALDNVSQAAVLSELAKMTATRIVIAHRLSTVRNADRIVVLERGRIVQQGTFRDLAAERGAFAAMLARQVA